MTDNNFETLGKEHRDFYKRFQSFWNAPSGPRVAEIIAPNARIHFSGQRTITGAEYVDVMAGLLGSMDDLMVTPIDCAGLGEVLYIYWNSTARIDGRPREWLGVDRFRIRDGMAIEEHVIFDTAALAGLD